MQADVGDCFITPFQHPRGNAPFVISIVATQHRGRLLAMFAAIENRTLLAFDGSKPVVGASL
jgi:hypothetical protein